MPCSDSRQRRNHVRHASVVCRLHLRSVSKSPHLPSVSLIPTATEVAPMLVPPIASPIAPKSCHILIILRCRAQVSHHAELTEGLDPGSVGVRCRQALRRVPRPGHRGVAQAARSHHRMRIRIRLLVTRVQTLVSCRSRTRNSNQFRAGILRANVNEQISLCWRRQAHYRQEVTSSRLRCRALRASWQHQSKRSPAGCGVTVADARKRTASAARSLAASASQRPARPDSFMAVQTC